MRKLAIAVVVLMLLCLGALPAALGDTLQDAELNINGTTYSGPGPVLGASGVNSVAFNTSTGVGTITVTVLGTACSSCNVDLWLWDPAAVPFFNEYGATSGSASTGQSWQVDVPDYLADGNTPALGGSIIGNTDGNSLSNSNFVTGTTSDYLGSCGAGVTAPTGNPGNSSCNDAVSMALGFSYTSPGTGNEELITFNVSTTGCGLGGVCLEDVHPADGNNTSSTTLYYTAVAESQPVCTEPSCMPPPPPPSGAPEPGTLLMLGSSLFGLVGLRKRFSTN